jgi:hypothetical protein
VDGHRWALGRVDQSSGARSTLPGRCRRPLSVSSVTTSTWRDATKEEAVMHALHAESAQSTNAMRWPD